MVSVDEPKQDDEEDEVYEFVEEETEQKSNPIPPTEDEVREHNLGTAENPQPNRLAKTNKTNTQAQIASLRHNTPTTGVSQASNPTTYHRSRHLPI